MTSPRQIHAYQTRFSTCEHPVNITYTDGSKTWRCVFRARGEYDQLPSERTSRECLNCEHFQKRETLLKEMSNGEFSLYEKYVIGKINYLKYKDRFET
jgi:hypothetical protein